MTVLAVVEHDRGTMTSASLGVLTAARNLAKQMNTKFEALTIGANADRLSETVANFGATTVHQAHNAMLANVSTPITPRTRSPSNTAASTATGPPIECPTKMIDWSTGSCAATSATSRPKEAIEKSSRVAGVWP